MKFALVTFNYSLHTDKCTAAGPGALLRAGLVKRTFASCAAGVHFEDQLASEKEYGHLGGKVLIPTSQHERSFAAARLAADTMGVPTIIVARTDAQSARLIYQRCGRARPALYRAERPDTRSWPTTDDQPRSRAGCREHFSLKCI